MPIPKITETEPNRRYGTISTALLFIKVEIVPWFLLLVTFIASFRLVDKAVLMGMIELRSGIIIPTNRAVNIADQVGMVDG